MKSPQSGRQRGPFWIRRLWLLAAGFRADRDAPDLFALSALQPAERFVWGVLPHAARSFAPCILALPSSMALSAALGYLYCRILDTHEDLIVDPIERIASLEHVALRLKALRDGETPELPPISTHKCEDARDEVHSLIAHELPRLDPLFMGLGADVQGLIIDLVEDMADGMLWAAGTFERQGGVLDGEPQVRTYCDAVLGNPIRFAARLYSLTEVGAGELTAEVEVACMDVGEYLQLANVTRDIEKDLLRGVAYDGSLAPFLLTASDEESEEIVRLVRVRLMRRALDRAPSYLTLIDGLELKRGWMAASALIMARFTERYYLSCATRTGVSTRAVRSAVMTLVSCCPALLSSAWTREQLLELEGELAALSSRTRDH